VKNGVELISLPETGTASLPDIAGLNMPLMDGKEVLLWIEKSKFEHIPVRIFTTSSRQQDMQLANYQCTLI
jgi:CheY-like chemotaxis protein